MKWYAPWIAVPLSQCAAIGCEEPRCVQEHANRLVARDYPEDIARRFCIRHAFEYDRDRLADPEPAEVVVLLFPRRAA